MSHFARVVNGKVDRVIVAEPDFFDTYVDDSPGQWLQTSYNTIGNKHVNGGTPLRGNFAGVDYTYDAVKDVFYAPQPFPSWTLSADYLWEAPVAMPADGKPYVWNEATKVWDEVAVVAPTA
jgi:hypothetical protein